MKRDPDFETTLREKYLALKVHFNERSRRIWAATEARAVGYGGVSAVARATGMSVNTVRKGLTELDSDEKLPPGQVRRAGAGRPTVIAKQPKLDAALDRLIDPITRGDPESPLRWTTKSAAKISASLADAGHKASSSTVWRLLRAKGYRLQSTKKTLERRHHDDRDGQFIFINGAVSDAHKAGQPAISVDTKKKELIGDFFNGGREWHPSGKPDLALSHDFPNDAEGKAIPYGVYDIERNEALVNIGVDHDTSAFAVESIRRWWHLLGRQAYPEATNLLITADAGGSNGYRRRAWKKHLQELANETNLTIQVVHFPPGTSKWNKIEHRLFCHLSKNWRGRPLRTMATVVELIGSTTTKTGLKVKALLDESDYPTGELHKPKAMKTLNIKRNPWHGEWNYTISPGGS